MPRGLGRTQRGVARGSGLESSRQPAPEVGLEKGDFTEHVSAFENRRGHVRE